MHQSILFFTFILSILTTCSYAQGSGLKMKVVDSVDDSPIPYATIVNGKAGRISNEYGEFVYDEDNNDILIISAIGYITDTIYTAQNYNQTIIVLDPIEYALPIVEVCAKKEKSTSVVGAIKRKGKATSSNCLQANIEMGLKVKNPYFNQSSHLREVSFFISKKGVPKTPFRVNVYEFDIKQNRPTKNILTSNVICTTESGGRWYEIDLSSYNIKVETEYCVIVFEWLYYDGVDEYRIYNSKSGKMCFGQTLGLTSSIESSLTWTRINKGAWANSKKRVNSNSQPLNAAINATFDTWQ